MSKIDAIVAKLNKKHGTMFTLKADELVVKPRITTGSLVIDLSFGGGWQTGTWHEIVGVESHGKTVVALQTVAANQAKDPDFVTVWVAAENYDAEWAEINGVDNSRVWLIETTSLEDAGDAVLEFMEAHVADLIVVDSMPALQPAAEEDADSLNDFPTMARAATLWGRIFRQTNRLLRDNNPEERAVTGLIINQWRDAVGVMYGDKRITPGGKAKNYFYASRVEVKRDDWIDWGKGNNKRHVGITIHTKTLKNKTAPPGQDAYVDFYFSSTDKVEAGSFDYVKEIVSQAILFGVIPRKGGWFYYGDAKWQGGDAVAEAVKADPDLAAQLTDEVLFLVTHEDSRKDFVDED